MANAGGGSNADASAQPPQMRCRGCGQWRAANNNHRRLIHLACCATAAPDCSRLCGDGLRHARYSCLVGAPPVESSSVPFHISAPVAPSQEPPVAASFYSRSSAGLFLASNILTLSHTRSTPLVFCQNAIQISCSFGRVCQHCRRAGPPHRPVGDTQPPLQYCED